MNKEAGELWGHVKKFYDTQSSNWSLLSPLLEGTTSLSHLDGSLYSPVVPEIVYKEHASAINKVRTLSFLFKIFNGLLQDYIYCC